MGIVKLVAGRGGFENYLQRLEMCITLHTIARTCMYMYDCSTTPYFLSYAKLFRKEHSFTVYTSP